MLLGSILGLLLFIICFNDIYHLSISIHTPLLQFLCVFYKHCFSLVYILIYIKHHSNKPIKKRQFHVEENNNKSSYLVHPTIHKIISFFLFSFPSNFYPSRVNLTLLPAKNHSLARSHTRLYLFCRDRTRQPKKNKSSAFNILLIICFPIRRNPKLERWIANIAADVGNPFRTRGIREGRWRRSGSQTRIRVEISVANERIDFWGVARRSRETDDSCLHHRFVYPRLDRRRYRPR